MARRKNPRVDPLSVRAVHLEEPNLVELPAFLVDEPDKQFVQYAYDEIQRRTA